MTRIKICGITTLKDALAAVEYGADFIGLILSESPRRVDAAKIKEITSVIDGKIKTVAVFSHVEDLISHDNNSSAHVDYYQVYFDPPSVLRNPPALGWIRSYWINGNAPSLSELKSQYTLLDFKNAHAGIMDETLAAVLESVSDQVILAGNLTVANVGGLIQRFHPFGVDAARATESSPGIKDHKLLRQFIDEVRNASA